MNKVLVYLFLPLMILSLVLSLAGIQHIGFDSQYYDFMRYTSVYLGSWKIEIPTIPTIDELTDVSGFLIVLNLLIKFINGIVTVINVVIQVLNILILLIQFLCSILICLFKYDWKTSYTPFEYEYLQSVVLTKSLI